MAKAKKLPSGSWRVRVYDGKGADGKDRYKSFTAATKREAEFLAAEYAAKRKSSRTVLSVDLHNLCLRQSKLLLLRI